MPKTPAGEIAPTLLSPEAPPETNEAISPAASPPEMLAETDEAGSPASASPQRKASGLKLVAAPRNPPPPPPDAPARRGRKGLKLVPAAGVEMTTEDAPPPRKKGWRIVPAGDADE